MQKVSHESHDDFILLSSRGYASRLISKTQASALLGIKETRVDEMDSGMEMKGITKVANLIVSDIKDMEDDRNNYGYRRPSKYWPTNLQFALMYDCSS